MTVALLSARSLRSLFSSDEALRAGPAVVGGKAYALARLSAVNVEVPAWLVLPASALEAQLRWIGLDRWITTTLAELHAETADPAKRSTAIARASRAIQQVVDALIIDPVLADELGHAAELLAPGPYAVRSSAVGEDGALHSWAGQFESVLGARDGDAIRDALRRCWRSAFSERALDYRVRANQLETAAQVAVILQRLVAADVSGVMFTSDPIGRDASRIRVSACWGLGDRLVGGEYDADEYLLTSDGAEISSRIARKQRRMIVRAGAVEEQDVAEPRCEARTLSPQMLRKLSSAGRRIADHEGGPRDIEWALAGNELYILQARPITAPPRSAADERRIVWDNSNIQESYYGVTTPLTFSFASAAYASVYEQTMRALGLPEKVVVAHRPMLRNLLGLIHGRVYYNLDNWYRGLLLLPAFRRNKEDMERMMGVEEPVDFVEDDVAGPVERSRRAVRVAGTVARLVASFATLPRDSVRFLARVDDTLGQVDRASLASRGLGELLALCERLNRECIDRWTTPIVNDFFVMMATGRLHRFVKRAIPSEDGQMMQVLLGGADVATSAGPSMILLRMAAIVRKDPALQRFVEVGDPRRALAGMRSANPRFAAAYEELLARFGDRCIGELKLESVPLRDDPRFVVQMLRNYLGAESLDATVLEERARAEREAAERRVAERLSIVGRVRFRLALRAARRGIRMREEMRLARTRLFGVYRDLFRAIGDRLHDAGRLETSDDIFYLTTGEIQAYWEGTSVSTDLAAIARARRREFASYHDLAAPNRIVTVGAPADGVGVLEPVNTESGDARRCAVLEGLGCSPGIAEGPVRIITSPNDDLSLAGHVLVAPRTDPGWAPLFPSAAAIVVERGSLLSHSAVLARELGLPAVVGIPGVVRALRDGERVRVNGSTGRVERLELECES